MSDARQLNGFDWLTGLPAEDLAALRDAATDRDYKPHQVIFAPSAEPRSVYLLESGLVRIYRLSEEGAEMTFGFVSPGEAFGEFAAFGDYQRESFAEAVEPSSVLKIRKGAFRKVFANNPELVLELARQIGERFKRIESRVEDLAFRNVRARVAHVLLELGEDFGIPEPGGLALDIHLTQAELATLVGTTRQTANTVLQELDHEGLIKLRNRRIVIVQGDELRATAGQTIGS